MKFQDTTLRAGWDEYLADIIRLLDVVIMLVGAVLIYVLRHQTYILPGYYVGAVLFTTFAFVVAGQGISDTRSAVWVYRLDGSGAHQWSSAGEQVSDPASSAGNYGTLGAFHEGVLYLVWNFQLFPYTLEIDVQLVRFGLDGPVMTLSASGTEGSRAEDEIEVEYGGDPIVIGFNHAYVEDVLKHMKGENLVLALDRPDSAAIFIPGEDTTKQVADSDDLCLLMPLRLND